MFSWMRASASAACFVAIAATVAVSASSDSSLILHESRQDAPRGFTDAGPANENTILTLKAALVQNNIAGLEQELYAVSTPGSARYGQHLTKDEVKSFVTPSAESSSLVNEWLSSNGITAKPFTRAGDWLEFNISVGNANKLLGANYHVYRNEKTGRQSLQTLSYSIPATLKGHLDLLHPTVSFSTFSGGPVAQVHARSDESDMTLPMGKKKPKPTPGTPGPIPLPSPVDCNTTNTPTCLQSLYGIPTVPATQTSNTLGVSAFNSFFANQTDLQIFIATLNPSMNPNTTYTIVNVDGDTIGEGNLETYLDVQYTAGLANGVPMRLYTVGGEDETENFAGSWLQIYNFILDEDTPPHVLSTSYGENEADISASLATQVCNTIMQLGAIGVSVIYASGDGGVEGLNGSDCTDFVPTFPSGCPYVTSVGATQNTIETAASLSAGGFSNMFPRPSYQSAAVSAYLSALGSTNAGLYNTTGRAYPDVAAQGINFWIVTDSRIFSVTGTSASCPTFASIVALLNDELVAAGKSPLGFLNPLLYSSAKTAFNDITTGNNPGCNTNGFPALAGWDAVTGWGTPNYPKLKAAIGL